MKKWLISLVALAMVVTVGGWAYVRSVSASAFSSSKAGFVCPLTGEELPCPKCCPLNK